MAVRGLGCPVRFTLTAGQKGDAPQADALIEGLPAEVVMADTAYDSDRLRQAIARKGAVAAIPNKTPRAPKNTPSTSTSTRSAIWSSAASQSSSSSDASPPDSKKLPATTAPSSLSPLPSYGSDNCPHLLERDASKFECILLLRSSWHTRWTGR